jgi:hypothetical protein
MGRSSARSRSTFISAIIALAAVTAAAGCGALLGFGDFTVDSTSDGGNEASSGGETGTDSSIPDDGGCIDPNGFGGRGCYRCVPMTNDQLLSACTKSAFEPFDNKVRIAGFDAKNPKPVLPEGGPPYTAFDAGTVVIVDPGDAGTPDPCPIDSTQPGGRQNAVFLLGATGFPLDVIQRAMGTEATIFYLEKGSCEGSESIISATVNTLKAGSKVRYYDENTGEAKDCNLQEDHLADLGMSALFAETCSTPLPIDVVDLLGPVNPVGFTAPATSNERVISGEAAYRVYGVVPSGVAPWDDEEFIFRRRASSGNQTTVALTLGVENTAMRGRDSNGSSNMLKAMQSSTSPQKTIGLSSSEILDINRPSMKWLAYQHFNQPVGFYPDSAATTFDRRNVRDGHYFIWIPLHVYARVPSGDIAGAPNQPIVGATRNPKAVKTLAQLMTSRIAAPKPAVDLFSALGKLGNVPQCAMRVTRAKEGAQLTPFKPSLSCACAFEAAVPNGIPPSDCVRCTDSSKCKDPTRSSCSFGFCE